MPDSVLERIAKNILATVAERPLAEVTNADGSSCVLRCERAKKLIAPDHLKGFIYQDTNEDVDDRPTGTDSWIQPFSVVVFVMPPDTDVTAVDAYNNAAAAAIYLALMSDYTRGGLAINTVIRRTLFFPLGSGVGEYAGITLQFDVHYRNAIDDPYTPAVE